MTTPAPPRIFLSYARRDGQGAADRLRARLTDPALTASEPLPLWQDLVSMRSGDWWEQIAGAIKAGDHLIMMVTPGALVSPVCCKEWHLARIEGKEISPVLVDTAVTTADLPKWMTAQHVYRVDLDAPDLAEQQEWTRLVASLREKPQSRKMPTISRTPGDRFVDRPEEMNALRDMLLDAKNDAVGIATAFAGSGGMGKTTLALALAHDPQIQTAFYGGQLLVVLGEKPDIPGELRRAIKDLTGEISAAQTQKEATEELANVLGERRVLIVIDDVWQERHLEPFLVGGRNCARLVTTRDEGVLLKSRAKIQHVDQMSEDQALALIGSGLASDDIKTHAAFLKGLANRLGRCALLLELANGRIWTWSHDRGGLDNAVDEAEIEFRFKGVTAFDHEHRPPVDLTNPDTRNDAYADSITASLRLLSDDHKARFVELAVFPEDADIPYGSVVLLWTNNTGMSERTAVNLLDRLKRMSLVTGGISRESEIPVVRMHDVIRAYALDEFRPNPDRLGDIRIRFWHAHVRAGDANNGGTPLGADTTSPLRLSRSPTTVLIVSVNDDKTCANFLRASLRVRGIRVLGIDSFVASAHTLQP